MTWIDPSHAINRISGGEALRRNRRRTRKHRKTAALKIIVVLLVMALFGVGGMAVYAYHSYRSNNQMMNAIVMTDKIYNNIYINGVNVGGMTREAAELVLKKEFIPELQDKKVTVTAGEHELELSFSEFSARYDFSLVVEQAYQYGKSGSLKERYDLVTALNEKPYHIEHKLEHNPVYSYDRGSISQKLEPLRDAVNIEPLNASITRKDGQFILGDSQIGRVLNTERTIDLIVAVLDSAQGGTVAAVIDEMRPEYETDDLAAVQALIGTYTTKVTPGSSGRNQNIITALSKINDAVLQPGEVFSTNQHFGRMTYDNGYREAPVIIGGQLENGMGGGVCQVSTTLYLAVLYAELEVVERMNHSLKVTYVDYGFDATLAGDYIDFKFKNDMDSPIFIEAMLINGTDVVVNIYGRETRPPGRSIHFSNRLIETVHPPGEPLETQDPSLPLGERVVKQRASSGYRYNVYKTIYENGIEIDRVLVNNSYYRPARGEVRVGTGEVAPEADDVVVADEPNDRSDDLTDDFISDIDIEIFDPAPIQPDDLLDEWLSPALPVIPDSDDGDNQPSDNGMPPDEELIAEPIAG